MRVLITGVAGFIGFHTANLLLKMGYKVYGLDSLNTYYSVAIKKKRIHNLKNKNFFFKKCNLQNEKIIYNFIKQKKINIIIHLAAQAGVRHSLKKPMDYVTNNISSTTNLLEACRKYKKIKHFY